MPSLWMVVAGFLFAAMGVCVKLLADTLTAPEIAFYRSLVSLLLMWVWMRVRGITLGTPYWRGQLFRGVSGFVSLLMYFYAITVLPLAMAMTLNYTSPLFLVFYLVWFSGLRLRFSSLSALLLGFCGVLVLLQPTVSIDQYWGGLIGLASGMLSGLAYFNVRSLGEKGEPEARTVFYFALCATLGCAVWMMFSTFHALSGRVVVLLSGVGAFGVLAQLAMTRAYRLGASMLVASFAYSAIIFASILGVLVLHETMPETAWLGTGLIVCSGIMASYCARFHKRV